MGYIIERAAKEAGMTIERDVPVLGQRRCKDWAKLIGIARKLESQDGEVLEAERATVTRLSTENVGLIAKVYDLEKKLLRFTLKERMEGMELPENDRQKLLAPAEEAVA